MLKAVVIGLGALIVIGLGVLVVGLATKLGGHRAATGETAARYVLPPGATITGMESQPNRLILRLRTPTAEEIDIIDTEDGHLVARIRAPH